MRASTADRDRVVDLLNNAYVDGRLTKEEFDGRMATALTAPTYGDLDRVLYDLVGTRAAVRRTNTMAIVSICGSPGVSVGDLGGFRGAEGDRVDRPRDASGRRSSHGAGSNPGVTGARR
jgi:hypothetical protein